ncbi:esterase-like activity of phytase family protein [Zobellia galactanivorans]|uniref:esterase-like activity of phytase family protein n=1 Tax=Zobellia galactanivorans (strain DSM 12802 / CCUG 47099 / CIP 106680 / NCIMB 13871 / Dsij) TaxID=63186 RepID=UPI0026E3BE18|nr:esterase-like activity of phytase family protein [Zobellia galactanivorans]MDO6810007.1 esterase-like activity of phytase family protein [Zobellia galactanivorans]
MKKLLIFMVGLCLLNSCDHIDDFIGGGPTTPVEVSPVEVLETNTQYPLPYSVLSTINNTVEIRNGGFGSGATSHPTKGNEFYAITDRGPNTDYLDGKKFPVVSYTPRIGHYRVTESGKIELLEEILLKDPSGQLISGIPNPEGKGATGEIPYDADGNAIAFDDFGLDSEGIVALKDGTFWVSDEYGPHIVHYNANGVQLERISPIGVNEDTGDRKLPAVFAKRRANRGMEGLAVTPDEKTLVGIMQSTMYNPEKIQSNITRIVTFNLETGYTRQYVYVQETANLSNSEITAISNTEFLVVERDGKFAGAGAAQKHIYKINLAGATDISGSNPKNELGLMVGDKTIEQSTAEELAEANIVPVQKELVVDLVAEFGYRHDKLEGIWLVDDNTLGFINDDDFTVSDNDGDGVIEQKILPGSTDIDASSLYLVKANF